MKPKEKETGQREAAISIYGVLVCGLIILCTGLVLVLFEDKKSDDYNPVGSRGLVIMGSIISIIPVFKLILRSIKKRS